MAPAFVNPAPVFVSAIDLYTVSQKTVPYKAVQQHNLGDVANSIPRLCTGTL